MARVDKKGRKVDSGVMSNFHIADYSMALIMKITVRYDRKTDRLSYRLLLSGRSVFHIGRKRRGRNSRYRI